MQEIKRVKIRDLSDESIKITYENNAEYMQFREWFHMRLMNILEWYYPLSKSNLEELEQDKPQILKILQQGYDDNYLIRKTNFDKIREELNIENKIALDINNLELIIYDELAVDNIDFKVEWQDEWLEEIKK